MVGLLSFESCCGRPKMRNSVLERLQDRKLNDMITCSVPLSTKICLGLVCTECGSNHKPLRENIYIQQLRTSIYAPNEA